MKRLIVNADDFGLTQSVNQAIVEGHRRGIISSATLLANGAAFDSAVSLARSCPQLGVGVHLNLTEGFPVSALASVPGPVNHNGHFRRSPVQLVRAISAGMVSLDDIAWELQAQIEKVRAAGIEITHLDGHKHVHMWPAVFDVVVRLALECGIPAVRCAVARPRFPADLIRANPRAWSKIILQSAIAGVLAVPSVAARRKLRRAGLAAVDRFIGIAETGFLNAACLKRILRNLPGGASELMCHPGYADEQLRNTGTRLMQQREVELDALTRPDVRALLGELRIELISYRQLEDSGPA